MNVTRTGLIDGAASRWAGEIERLNQRTVGGEPVADLRVRASALNGITVDPAIVPSMVDEFPVFFIAAACAKGRTTTSGLDELRVKEFDRLATMARGLEAIGVPWRSARTG